jgi:hypothetical protein
MNAQHGFANGDLAHQHFIIWGVLKYRFRLEQSFIESARDLHICDSNYNMVDADDLMRHIHPAPADRTHSASQTKTLSITRWRVQPGLGDGGWRLVQDGFRQRLAFVPTSPTTSAIETDAKIRRTKAVRAGRRSATSSPPVHVLWPRHPSIHHLTGSDLSEFRRSSLALRVGKTVLACLNDA